MKRKPAASRISTPSATSTTPPSVDSEFGKSWRVSSTCHGGWRISKPKRSTAIPKIISDSAVRVHTASVRSVFMYERCSDSSTSWRATCTWRLWESSVICIPGALLHEHEQQRQHDHAQHRHHHGKRKCQPRTERFVTAMLAHPDGFVGLVPDGRRHHDEHADGDQADAAGT